MLETISAGGKTWTEIREETGLSRPVVSGHMTSLLTDGLIACPDGPGERGSKYEITPKGQEFLVRERNRQFDRENPLFLSFDLRPEPPKPRHQWLEKEVSKEELESLKLPEEILEDRSRTFPVPVQALLVMNENGKAALDPWTFRMLTKYGYVRPDTGAWIQDGRGRMDDDPKWIDEMVASSFADPTIEKLCEVLFERTRVLCSLHRSGEKGVLPTMDNILNFNFQFSCRYEGENFLNSASKEERISTQHLLAGMLLLYLGGGGGGPMESFSWDKEDLEALVKSGILTRGNSTSS